MSDYPQLGSRAVLVVEELTRLTGEVRELERGLDDRHLRILCMWHYGLSDSALFPKSTLREMGILSNARKKWSVDVRLNSRTYELIHEPVRPEFPLELARRMVLEVETSRGFHRELVSQMERTVFTTRGPPGTIVKVSAYIAAFNPHLVNPKSAHPGGKSDRRPRKAAAKA